MELSQFFKSLVDQDETALVLCDLQHTIVYMNPSAVTRYERWGGEKLLGRSLLDCHNARSRELIEQVLDYFRADPGHNRVFTGHNAAENKDVYMIALRDEAAELIGYYELHRYRSAETGRAYADIPEK